MMLSTPAGMPARSASSAAASAVSGVSSAGLMTTGQPAASAGATLRVIMASGKFHGVMAAHTPMGCFKHQQAAVVVELGQRFAVDALGLLGKPFHKAGAVGHFALGFGQGLALLGGHQAAQVVLVRHEQVVPLAQDVAAFLGGLVFPGRPGGIGGGNGGLGIGRPQVGHIGELLAGGRVVHIKPAGCPVTHWPLISASVFSRVGSFSSARGEAFMSMVVSGGVEQKRKG
jgi:hypothetical protein